MENIWEKDAIRGKDREIVKVESFYQQNVLDALLSIQERYNKHVEQGGCTNSESVPFYSAPSE